MGGPYAMNVCTRNVHLSNEKLDRPHSVGMGQTLSSPPNVKCVPLSRCYLRNPFHETGILTLTRVTIV